MSKSLSGLQTAEFDEITIVAVVESKIKDGQGLKKAGRVFEKRGKR